MALSQLLRLYYLIFSCMCGAIEHEQALVILLVYNLASQII
ncbi:hypothetical protein [Nostoc sp.]